jgi:hypothetical protein
MKDGPLICWDIFSAFYFNLPHKIEDKDIRPKKKIQQNKV